MTTRGQLETLIRTLNLKYPELGSGFDITEHSSLDWIEELEENDIVVGYDYCTDDIRCGVDDKKNNEFIDWVYEEAWPSIRDLMRKNGYRSVRDDDGSGNGLYYGIEVFRK